MSVYATSHINAFGTIGPELEKRGFFAVPVPPGVKGPRCPGWSTPTPVADRLPRHYRDGVAILTSNAPALDIDVDDERLALELRDAARSHLGNTSERIGRTPRRALVYGHEGDEPIRRMALTWNGGGIEILGAGQALTVAGLHPITGEPYTWIGPPVWQTDLVDLPGLTRATAVRFMRAAARFLQRRGITTVTARGFVLQPVPPRRPAAPACQVSDRYLARAVERAEDIVRKARCGERSDTLNMEAYSLARFAAEDRISAAEIETRLLAATALPQHEARATIRSALRARGAIDV